MFKPEKHAKDAKRLLKNEISHLGIVKNNMGEPVQKYVRIPNHLLLTEGAAALCWRQITNFCDIIQVSTFDPRALLSHEEPYFLKVYLEIRNKYNHKQVITIKVVWQHDHRWRYAKQILDEI